MIVAATGGRDFNDIERVRRALYCLGPKPTLLIHGAAQGADGLGLSYAYGVLPSTGWAGLKPRRRPSPRDGAPFHESEPPRQACSGQPSSALDSTMR